MDLFKNDSDSSSESSLEEAQDMAFGDMDQSQMKAPKKTHVADFQLLP